MGNIAAGKSTIIDGVRRLLEGRGFPSRHHEIEKIRLEVLRGKETFGQEILFSWADEDSAYSLLWNRIHNDHVTGRISFMESSGIAKRMTRWRETLRQEFGSQFIEVLVACYEGTCIAREKGREKRLDEFPLPFGHRPVGLVIKEMSNKILDLPADLVVNASDRVEMTS